MALNYLLSPEFQISVTSGKPDTGGWVETYLAGTRTKYFTSCDFNGTLNPFRVPLDSLGQAVILADTGSLYDVYVFNRYGTLLFSRYNVAPQDGGAISTANITSTDGSITVTQTEHGVDLSVNGHEASVLRATAAMLTSDGQFTFTRRQKTGDAVDVGQQGNILAKQGWFHYDVTVRYRWDSVLSNQSVPVTLSTNVGSSVGVFDLSYAHDVTDTLSGEWRSNADNTEFRVDVSGIPQGMTVEIVDFGIHAINGGGSGSGGSGGATYTGIDGIIVDNDNGEIKPDFDVLQYKLTEGSNIDITDNVISAEVPTLVSELQNDVGYITSADLPTIPVTDVTVDGTSVVVNGVAEITMPVPPTIPVTDVTVDGSSVVHNGVAEITMPTFTQQNADWDSNSGVTEILHKPDLSIYAQSANLATVATTGDYDDLVNKPAIPAAQVNSDWNSNSGVSQILNKPSLATVATTGDYSDLVNKPSIPAAQVNADWNANTGVSEILNKPQDLVQDANYVHTDNNYTNADKSKLAGIASGAEVNVQSNWSETDTTADSYIQNKPQFAAVAMTGSYADLLNTPTIPSVDQQYSASSANAQSGTAVAEALSTISVDEVPPVTSSDDGKVLTADYYQGVGSYSWETPQNQVPSSTPADYGKVLTVTSVGGLSWEAYGSSGSLDPGRIWMPNNHSMRLRFGDTTYDPTVQPYASNFTITRVSDGIYDFDFSALSSYFGLRDTLKEAFTDITNNPVDILAFRSGYGSNQFSFFRMFYGCTGLRSVWNINSIVSGSQDGYNGTSQMFAHCSNLIEIHGYRSSDTVDPEGGVNLESSSDAESMFADCTSLRVADIVIRGYNNGYSKATASSAYGICSHCESLVQAPVLSGYFSSFMGAFQGCTSLVRLSDNPTWNYDSYAINGDDPGSPVAMSSMFANCHKLKDIHPLSLGMFGEASSVAAMFYNCYDLEDAPHLRLSQGASMHNCFSDCHMLTEAPDWDYTKISDADSAFNNCFSLKRIHSGLDGLATSATNVDNLFARCVAVSDGALRCYNALAASSTITSHSDTFWRTGKASGNDQSSNIPTSWGGTAT